MHRKTSYVAILAGMSLVGMTAASFANNNDPFAPLQSELQKVRFSYASNDSGLPGNETARIAQALCHAGGVQLERVALERVTPRVEYRSELDRSAIFELDTATGDLLFNKGYGNLRGEESTPNLPSPEIAPRLAIELLHELGVTPAQASEMKLDHVGGVNMGAHREDGSTEIFQKLVTVRFGRMLDGLPVDGPGSRIVVRMSSGGQLAGLIRRWYEVSPRMLSASEMFSLAEIRTIAQACIAKASLDAVESEIKSAELVLFDDGHGVIEPAVYVTSQFTFQAYHKTASGGGELKTFTNPYDFYVPVLRRPQAQFPFMNEGVPRPAGDE
ncbi:MAG: hypothetical protein AB1486_31560 [Planctomycetota bacterium]